MKILIMVLSYNQSPFSNLMRVQQDTWDSINGAYSVYYHGGAFDNDTMKLSLKHSNGNKYPWERVEFQCTDAYYYMASKFKMALKYVFDDKFEHNDFDLIFRTNSSSYVNKARLIEFAETLPKEKLYGGWTFVDSEDFGGLCVSGAGIFLSRDTAKILMDEIDPEKELEEDVYIGRILRKHGIIAFDDKSRFDIPQHFGIVPLDRYHYRLKTTGNRLADIGNMKKLHNILMSNQ